MSNLVREKPFCEQAPRLLGRRQEIGHVIVVSSCHLAFDPPFNNQPGDFNDNFLHFRF